MSESSPLKKGRAKRVMDARRKDTIRRSLENAVLGATVAMLTVALIRLLG